MWSVLTLTCIQSSASVPSPISVMSSPSYRNKHINTHLNKMVESSRHLNKNGGNITTPLSNIKKWKMYTISKFLSFHKLFSKVTPLWHDNVMMSSLLDYPSIVYILWNDFQKNFYLSGYNSTKYLWKCLCWLLTKNNKFKLFNLKKKN